MLTRRSRGGRLNFKSKRQYGKTPKKGKKGKSTRKRRSVSKKSKKLKGGS